MCLGDEYLFSMLRSSWLSVLWFGLCFALLCFDLICCLGSPQAECHSTRYLLGTLHFVLGF